MKSYGSTSPMMKTSACAAVRLQQEREREQ